MPYELQKRPVVSSTLINDQNARDRNLLERVQNGWRIATTPDPLPQSALLGLKPQAASDLFARSFGESRIAHRMAARLALGLSTTGEDHEELRREIIREHAMFLTTRLPEKLRRHPVRQVLGDDVEIARAVFGRFMRAPRTVEEMGVFLDSREGIGPLLDALAYAYRPGAATTDRLPMVSGETMLTSVAVENSAAARHADHMILRYIEVAWGRGPLWRVMGRVLDLQACIDGTPPLPAPLSQW